MITGHLRLHLSCRHIKNHQTARAQAQGGSDQVILSRHFSYESLLIYLASARADLSCGQVKVSHIDPLIFRRCNITPACLPENNVKRHTVDIIIIDYLAGIKVDVTH